MQERSVVLSGWLCDSSQSDKWLCLSNKRVLCHWLITEYRHICLALMIISTAVLIVLSVTVLAREQIRIILLIGNKVLFDSIPLAACSVENSVLMAPRFLCIAVVTFLSVSSVDFEGTPPVTHAHTRTPSPSPYSTTGSLNLFSLNKMRFICDHSFYVVSKELSGCLDMKGGP